MTKPQILTKSIEEYTIGRDMVSLRERAAVALMKRGTEEAEAAKRQRDSLVGRDPNSLGDVLRSTPAALSSLDHSVNTLVFYAAARAVAPPSLRREMPPVRRLLFPHQAASKV